MKVGYISSPNGVQVGSRIVGLQPYSIYQPKLKPIDQSIPGVQKVIKHARTARNKHIKKGFVTELYYAKGIFNDPNFQLIEMERSIKTKLGRTDADIIYRVNNGLFGRLEIKNISMKTQENPEEMRRIKRQIDKMELEKKRTGALQAIVNRRALHPELKVYAKLKGVAAYENVSRNQLQSILLKEVKAEQLSRAMKGGAGLGFGLFAIVDSAPRLVENLKRALSNDAERGQNFRDLGLNSTGLLLGSAMTLTSGAHIGGQYSSEARQEKLFRYARMGGIATIGLLALTEVQMINSYIEEDLNSREFWTTQFVMSAGAGGGVAGTYAGAVLAGLLGSSSSGGVLGAASVTIGATGGGIAGTWLGSSIGGYFADYLYGNDREKFEKRLDGYIFKRHIL